MKLYRRLTLKAGDIILRQDKKHALVPMPETTKAIRENASFIADDKFMDTWFEEGKHYWVYKASRQAYLHISFRSKLLLIEC